MQKKLEKKIGIDIDVKPEMVTTENLAPVVEVTEKETPKTEAAPEVKEKKEETKSKNISEKK